MSELDKEPDQLNDSLQFELNQIANSYGITLSQKKCGPAFSELIKALYALPHITLPDSTDKAQTDINLVKFSQLPVVLIDEYDSPLTRYVSQPEKLQANREILLDFYTNVKACSRLLRLGFITGITLFQELSVFSSMNSFQNITFDPDFSKICGFTEEEIKTYYENNINRSLLAMQKNQLLSANWTKDDFIRAIIAWYDGYSWDGKSSLINPQSIKEFFKFNKFKNYWYSTAGPHFLEQLKFLNMTDLINVFDSNFDIPYNSVAPDLSVINPESALFQTGYLTIDRESGIDGSFADIYLKVPNKEVKISFAREYLIQHFFPDLNKDERKGLCRQYDEFSSYFIRHDSKNAASVLSSIFANFSHQTQLSGEHFFQSQTKSALSLVGHVTEERSVGGGDIDLVLENSGTKTIYVIEIKYRKSPILSERIDNSEISNLPTPSTSSIITSGLVVAPEKTGDSTKIKFDSKDIQKNRTLDERLKVKHALKLAIRDAFVQIRKKEYAKGFLYQDKTVYSVAIAVIGRSDVKIKFRKVSPSDFNL
jgi:Holliday junction resolvase-like predicted endonuclease